MVNLNTLTKEVGMKIKVEFEFSITQAEVAEYHEVSRAKAREAMEDLDEEAIQEFVIENFEGEIREAIIEEFANHIDL
jgi:hypothetical protein